MSASPLAEIYESRNSNNNIDVNAAFRFVTGKSKNKSPTRTESALRRANKRREQKTRKRAQRALAEVVREAAVLVPEKMDEHHVVLVEKAIVDFFRDGYMRYKADEETVSDGEIIDYIRNLFRENGVIVSGGFVLKSMGLLKASEAASSIDIDIYVPSSVKKQVYTDLSELFNCDRRANGVCEHKYFKAAPGAKGKGAFFTKNGIYSVTKFSKSDPKAEMDLVRANRTTKPIRIVQNFDLSFCQNWYDGKNVYSMDKSAVLKEKTGYLTKEYVEGFMEGNPVTADRIYKYIRRGFGVSYIHPESGDLIEVHLPSKP